MVKEAKGGSDSIQEECADERRGWTLGDCQDLLDEQRETDLSLCVSDSFLSHFGGT